MLDLLKQNLEHLYDPDKEEFKYSLEDSIHELIMPMRVDSSQVRFEDHNLWVIDETLAFHEYLASDLQMKKVERLNTDSQDRMDLILFQRGFITASTNQPMKLESITIIEFKRPGRDDYVKGDVKKDPVEQVIKYIRKIRSDGFKTSSGKQVASNKIKEIPIFVYIIADITPSLNEIIEGNSFDPAPDPNHGAYFYHKTYKAYFEVLSYDKLVERAKIRNQAFFEKLGLPMEAFVSEIIEFSSKKKDDEQNIVS